jgi:hypothetical protein
MTTFLYRCPTTRLKVQGWIADDPTEPEDRAWTHVSIECLACRQTHLVDPSSGKVAGDEEGV